MTASCPLQGVPVVVTGASRGIGAAVAVRLGGMGGRIAVIYRQDDAAAAGVVNAVDAVGSEAIALRADVSRSDEVERIFEAVETRFGTAGVLINNAGVHRGGRADVLRVEDWQVVIDTNLTGPFLCCRRALPGMHERGGGEIVNVSSVVGLKGYPGDAAYGAAKAGLIGLTRSLALEHARFGVRVNALAPGFVDTDMTRALEPWVLDRLVKSIPAGRQASTEEVADAVAFLVSGPRYMTGATMVLDGGWTIA